MKLTKIPTLKIAIALLVLASTAHAELGDTYATSCNRFQGAGTVDKINNVISWWLPDANPGDYANWVVTEQFNGNKCVVIIYSHHITAEGGISEEGIWLSLTRNSRPNQIWREYKDNISGNRAFATHDGKVYATVWNKGDYTFMRVAYKTWLERNHLFTAPNQEEPTNNTLPPVQESSI